MTTRLQRLARRAGPTSVDGAERNQIAVDEVVTRLYTAINKAIEERRHGTITVEVRLFDGVVNQVILGQEESLKPG